MAELSKDEIQADAILDAATPPTSSESEFPEFGGKKASEPAEKKSLSKKAAPPPASAPKVPNKPIMAERSKVAKSSSTSNDLFKKGWRRLNQWGLGISGKVILLLIVIGIFSEIVQHF